MRRRPMQSESAERIIPRIKNKAFPAKYPGQCVRCEQPIRPGQSVRYTDSGLAHTVHRGAAAGNNTKLTQ